MTRFSAICLFACTAKPTASKDDSALTDSGGIVEAAECLEPQLLATHTWTSSDFVDTMAPPPPAFLGTCGWGMAAIDLNQDNDVDLVVVGVNGGTWALVNHGGVLAPSEDILFDGGPLVSGNGLAVGDVNQDGRPDLVLLRSKGDADRLYLNMGGGRFESTPIVESSEESQHGSLFDADGDGDLDLFVSRHIDIDEPGIDFIEELEIRGNENGFYLNNDGVFMAAAVPGVADAATFQSVPMDVDNDGDLDLYLVNDFGMFIAPNELLINDGAGGFSLAEDCGCAVEMFGMGAAASDFDNDGLIDLHLSNFGSPKLLSSVGPARFVDTTAASGALIEPSADHVSSWGTIFVDINQDGWDEIATVFGPVVVGIDKDWTDNIDHPAVNDLNDSPIQRNMLLYNEKGQFEDRSASVGFEYAGISRAVVSADFNNDGMPDLAVTGLGSDRSQVVVVVEAFGGCGPGITVAFPAVGGRDIGATVAWSVEGVVRRRWYLPGGTFSSSGPTMHLGLGVHDAADWVRVTRLGGEIIEHTDVKAGTEIVVR